MRLAWIIWLAAAALLTGYCQLALFVSRSTPVPIVLAPGQTTTVDVYRIAGPSALRMELHLDEAMARRIHTRDSGTYQRLDADHQVILGDISERGVFTRYTVPGATVRLTVATPDAAAVTFDSFPHSLMTRTLSSNLYIEPGLVRARPESAASIALPSGTTPIRVTILTVDPPLLGAQATLVVAPLLGFKMSDSRVGWLGWGLFWPVFVAIMLAWFAILLGTTIWRWARGY